MKGGFLCVGHLIVDEFEWFPDLELEFAPTGFADLELVLIG